MLQLEKSIHWKNLQQLALQYRDIHLRELFTREGNRFETYSIELPNLLLDYSKNCLTCHKKYSGFGAPNHLASPTAPAAKPGPALLNWVQ